MSKRIVSATVNGEPMEFLAEPYETLLEVLRNEVGLTGSKEGCGNGNCGACNVVLNGSLVNSCCVLGVEANGGHHAQKHERGQEEDLEVGDPVDHSHSDARRQVIKQRADWSYANTCGECRNPGASPRPDGEDAVGAFGDHSRTWTK